MPMPPRYRIDPDSRDRFGPADPFRHHSDELFAGPPSRRRTRGLGLVLLIVAAAALITGLLWPSPPIGGAGSSTDPLTVAKAYAQAVGTRDAGRLSALACVALPDAARIRDAIERERVTIGIERAPVVDGPEAHVPFRIDGVDNGRPFHSTGTLGLHRRGGGWCVDLRPDGVPADIASAQLTPDATAAAQGFVDALNRRDVPALGQLTCESGVAAQAVEQRLVTGPPAHAQLIGPVTIAGGMSGLMRLRAGDATARADYTATLNRVNGTWCVSTLLAGPGN